MHAQQDETKKFIDFDLYINNDFEFYFNEVIVGVTDDKFDIDTHSTSKFLFYHFNDLRLDLGEKAYKVRHTIFRIINTLQKVYRVKIGHISLVIC